MWWCVRGAASDRGLAGEQVKLDLPVGVGAVGRRARRGVAGRARQAGRVVPPSEVGVLWRRDVGGRGRPAAGEVLGRVADAVLGLVAVEAGRTGDEVHAAVGGRGPSCC